MILADTLALATRKVDRPLFHESQMPGNGNWPRLAVDFATLTGKVFRTHTLDFTAFFFKSVCGVFISLKCLFS